MKRLSAPASWRLERKTKAFAPTPVPGPHAKKACIPAAVILRDHLKHAETMKEAKTILAGGTFRVDGTVRKKPQYGAGLMDVVSVGSEHYRILPGEKGLRLIAIPAEEAALKPKRIKRKTVLRTGKIQLAFHDGTTMLADGAHKPGDTLMINLATKDVQTAFRQAPGATVIITKGTSIGGVGALEKIIMTDGSSPRIAVVSTGAGKLVLPADYVFVIGADKPAITTGE